MNLLLIVVVFNKRITEIEYIKNINNVDVLIYDNSQNPQDFPESIHYYHNSQNGGVSIAYNYGIRLALKLKKDFILILDQDSSFDVSMLETYKLYTHKFGMDYLYAPIVKSEAKVYSPYFEGKFKNYPQDIKDFNNEPIYHIEGKSLINSGLMIPLKIISKIGTFNENIKLDFSDTYFIEQYKKQFNSIILMNVYLEHNLSGDEGKNKQKELNRFKYFCNGARIYKDSTVDVNRVKRLIIYRLLRLIIKYKTISPLRIYLNYYKGDLTI